MNAVPLGVLYKRSGRVESHRLVIQDRTEESLRVLHFDVSRIVGKLTEGRGMRFRKAVEGEGANVLDNLILRLWINTVLRHPSSELAFEIFHSFPGTFHPYGAAQLVRVSTTEIASNHRHLQ